MGCQDEVCLPACWHRLCGPGLGGSCEEVASLLRIHEFHRDYDQHCFDLLHIHHDRSRRLRQEEENDHCGRGDGVSDPVLQVQAGHIAIPWGKGGDRTESQHGEGGQVPRLLDHHYLHLLLHLIHHHLECQLCVMHSFRCYHMWIVITVIVVFYSIWNSFDIYDILH